MKIDGKQIARKILEELKIKVKKLQVQDIAPCLAIILIGNDPASLAYIRQKKLKAKNIGVKALVKHLPKETSEFTLIKTVQQFNNDNDIHGIVVQQPLPPQINPKNIVKAIDPKKDIDGFHPDSYFEMPIAMAVLKILEEIRGSTSEVEPQFADWLKNKRIVIMGKGETGGKPIIKALQKLGIKPTVIDSKTMNHELLTKNADIIISAVGKHNIITADSIKKDVILIAVGLSKGKDGKLHGDYEENEIKNKASFYAPTPGGVGPVNVAYLLKNLVKSAKNLSIDE